MAGSTAQDKRQQRQKARLLQFLAAGKRHLVPDAKYMVGPTLRTGAEVLADLAAMLQPHLDLDDAIARARALTGQARANVRKTLPSTGTYLEGFGGGLRARYGQGNPLLTSFGLPTGLRREPSAQTKAEAALQRLNTRKERHTMGKRQRQKIKGAKATLVLMGPDGKPLPKKGGK